MPGTSAEDLAHLWLQSDNLYSHIHITVDFLFNKYLLAPLRDGRTKRAMRRRLQRLSPVACQYVDNVDNRNPSLSHPKPLTLNP